MIKLWGFRSKIILPILLTLVLLFAFLSAIFTRYIRQTTQRQIDADIMGLLLQKREIIHTFFAERARIPQVVFQDPILLRWLDSYHSYRQDLRHDMVYPQIQQYFQRIIRSDSTVKSIYFATANTYEYFDNEGRYEAEGYSVKERSWWIRALEKDRLYCELGDEDLEDLSTPASLNMTIYRDDGKLLGVGGLDIQINSVRNLVRSINYQNTGGAFLVDQNARMIDFPKMAKNEIWQKTLTTIDEQVPDSYGFYRLEAAIQDTLPYNRLMVTWKGQPNMVYWTPIEIPELDIHWTLGMLIPESVVTRPVQRVTWIAGFGFTLMTFCIACIIFCILSWSIKPLNLLAQRLKELGAGHNDLHSELPVSNHDAVGKTLHHFNEFISQIRHFLLRVDRNSTQVNSAMVYMKEQVAQFEKEAADIEAQIHTVQNASSHMMEAVNQIQHNIIDMANHTKIAFASTERGDSLVKERISNLEALRETTLEFSKEIDSIKNQVKTLLGASQAIDEISKRTSILSVNANIEAVKAGEFGIGFRSVAEEIREISVHTAKTNKRNIETMNQFEEQMEVLLGDFRELQKKIQNEIKESNQIQTTFRIIRGDVSRTDEAANIMKHNASRQLQSVTGVSDNINEISDGIQYFVHSVQQFLLTSDQIGGHIRELQLLLNAYELVPKERDM